MRRDKVLTYKKSSKLDDVRYDIRGQVAQEAFRLEQAGHQILPLHIGNPAKFGFYAPDEMLQDIIQNLPLSQGIAMLGFVFCA